MTDIFGSISYDNPGEIFLLDGGTGEELFRQGVHDDRKIWSATAVVNPEYHSILKKVHRSFIEAGSQAITTNTYGIVPGVGFTDTEIQEYSAIAGKIAREAVTNTDTLVFGSLGPLVESYRADLIMSHDSGVHYYELLVKSLMPYVDAFLAETMSCLEESKQAIDAVANVADQYPMLVSFTLRSDGRCRDGENIVGVIKRLIDYTSMKSVKVSGILFNCAEPEAISSCLQEIKANDELQSQLRSKHILLGAYANRLTPIDLNWTLQNSAAPQPFRSDLDPKAYYETFVSNWVTLYNVRIVGGCCGIEPSHIAYIQDQLKK